MTPELADLFARTNPWQDDPARLPRLARQHVPTSWVPRLAAEDLQDAIDDPGRAHVLVGPRQAGKSALVWAILTQRRDPVLHVPCKNVLVREWALDPAGAAADIAAWLPAGGRVFLEDAHILGDPAAFLSGLLAAGLPRPVIATATSTAQHFAAVPATLHRVWPLSLVELAAPLPGEPPALADQRRRRAVDGMLLFGGFPQAWTVGDPQPVLGELVDDAVLRDASDRFRVAHPGAFRRLLSLAAGQLGQVVNHSEWSRLLGIASPTVSDYLAILEETHVLRRVRPFSGGRRAELTRAPRLYFVDNGLRNAVRGGFTPLERRSDVGPLHANLVFSELVKRFDGPAGVRCWRTRNGAELDFVLEPSPGRLIGVVVKATTESRPRLPRAARSFVDAYGPEQLWMVTRGPAWEEPLGKTRVRGVPLEQLPEALSAL